LIFAAAVSDTLTICNSFGRDRILIG
jgi:hypothetical protein